ncbi:hypothetical protein [Pseudonocardia sp. GCM10023141]|uniref:hypothetical protein n=1 Tax=Pseudonocardia sp. GCM10023141 TaxID=3252653 RepID=UPI00360FD3FF
MIALVIAGIGFIAVVAVVVGIVDAARASAWRRIAAERRRTNWEARRPEYHGIDGIDPYDPDDDD